MRVTTNHCHNLTPATPRLLSGVHPVQITACRSPVSGSCLNRHYQRYRPATQKPSTIMSATSEVEPHAEALVLAPETAAVDPRAAQSRLHRGPRLPGHKRSLALHIAYVGTSFQGFQSQKDLAFELTVEGTVRAALNAAGLIADSNMDEWRRIKWSRSSRTDKGVHSLATVVGVRLVLDDDNLFDNDPEGTYYVDRVNAKLPPSVRVLSMQRVNKKFSARRACANRTYEYHLPCSVLSCIVPPYVAPATSTAETPAAAAAAATAAAVAGSNGVVIGATVSDAVLAERLQLLRSALASFVGNHAFHNYTKRSVYSRSWDKAPENAVASKAQPGDDDEEEGDAEDEGPDSDREADGRRRPAVAAAATAAAAGSSSATAAAAAAAAAAPTGSSTQDNLPAIHQLSLGGSTTDDSSAAAVATAAAPAVPKGPRQWQSLCAWSVVPAEQQYAQAQGGGVPSALDTRHYRHVSSFTVEDAMVLTEGGVPCYRLTVKGDSFLLNQIRKMIGGAVAVAHGFLPLELIQASLAAPAIVVIPMAPPHSLMLVESGFSPFRRIGDSSAVVSQWSGDQLEMHSNGKKAQELFREQVLNAEVNSLLDHEDWAFFSGSLTRYEWDANEVQSMLEQHRTWKIARDLARIARAQRLALEVAEAKAAAAALEALEDDSDDEDDDGAQVELAWTAWGVGGKGNLPNGAENVTGQ